MAIYDINGNVISSGGSGELTDGSVLTDHIADGAVTLGKLGFGSKYNTGKPFFSNTLNFDSSASGYGIFGIVIQINAGDTVYSSWTPSTLNGQTSTIKILSVYPDGYYGTISQIGTMASNTDNAWTISASDYPTAKAVLVPYNFLTVPAESNTDEASAVSYIKNYLKSQYCQTISFDDVPLLVQKSGLQTEFFEIDDYKKALLSTSLMEWFCPLVHSKVLLLGDSISFQSASTNSIYDANGWLNKLAKKYMFTWEGYGRSMCSWYDRSDRDYSCVEDIDTLISGGAIDGDYDYIIIEYGTNDIWTGSLGSPTDAASNQEDAGTCAGMRYAIETLQSNFPSAHILVIMPCMRNNSGLSPTAQETYWGYADTILDEYGIKRVYPYQEAGIVLSMMNSDGVHLATSSGSYDNSTQAVARYSRCVEIGLLTC